VGAPWDGAVAKAEWRLGSGEGDLRADRARRQREDRLGDRTTAHRRGGKRVVWLDRGAPADGQRARR
jgi:hypothetical protein